MNTPSAVSSKVEGISLNSSNSYHLNGVKEKEAEQVYEELKYNSVEVVIDSETYSTIIENLKHDANFITKIANEIREKLEAKHYEHAIRVAGNIAILTPTLIEVLEMDLSLQNSKTPEEVEQGVYNKIVEFALSEKYLLSKYVYGPDAKFVIAKAKQEMVLDFFAGNEIYPTDEEIEEEFQLDEFASEYGIKFTKKTLGKFFSWACENYSDDILSAFSSWLNNNFPSFVATYGNKFANMTVLKFLPTAATTAIFGGSVDVVDEYANIILESAVKSTIKTGAVTTNLTTSTVGKFFEIGSNGIQLSSSLGSFNVAKYTNEVNNLLSGNGTLNKIANKLFVGSGITTEQQFYNQLIKNTTLKATASQAVKSGVTSLVVTSIFAFGGGVVDAWNEGERNPLNLIGAGASEVLDNTPKIISTAVGTTVGHVVGSYAGAALGFAIGGPVGAFIGEKIGGFLGDMVGGWIGAAVGENIQTKLSENEVTWWNPLTWF